MIESRILKEAIEMEEKSRTVFINNVFYNGYELNNLQRLKFEESNRILSLRTIQKICVKYRLRFLDFQLFKGDLPKVASEELERINANYKVDLRTLRLLAPENYFGLLSDETEEDAEGFCD